jgi:cell division protein FtsZ
MTSQSENMSTNASASREGSRSIRIFGVGDAGLSVIERLISDGLSPGLIVAINTGGAELERCGAARCVRLESKRLRGLGSGGDPERGRRAAEEKSQELKELCEGAEVMFIAAGLGGGSGTGISPVLARIAKAAGALVLAFVTTPFACEGTHRQAVADQGLEELREAADGVICLPNQRILQLIEENTSVIDTFKIANQLLADAMRGVWRLVSFKGLIEIPLEDLCGLLQDRHFESAFAVAEAEGADRQNTVMKKLLAHPMLEDGEVLSDAEAIIVSLTGGPNLTMAEVNHIVEQIKAKCGPSQVRVGACIDQSFGERLAVTLFCVRGLGREPALRGRIEELDTQLLDRSASLKPGSRFLPPPPTLPPEKVAQMLSQQARGRSTPRRVVSKMRQAQLPLEIVSKGRFDRSEPTIHKGEDLDVPTYLRRGVPLN